MVAHGLWHRGATTIFDVRIADTDAPTYRNRNPAKVLAAHAKQKDKYLEDSLSRRRHFTPLMFSEHGLRGVNATAAGNRLAVLLSAKWNRLYPDVCGYVRSRLTIVPRTALPTPHGTTVPDLDSTSPRTFLPSQHIRRLHSYSYNDSSTRSFRR